MTFLINPLYSKILLSQLISYHTKGVVFDSEDCEGYWMAYLSEPGHLLKEIKRIWKEYFTDSPILGNLWGSWLLLHSLNSRVHSSNKHPVWASCSLRLQFLRAEFSKSTSIFNQNWCTLKKYIKYFSLNVSLSDALPRHNAVPSDSVSYQRNEGCFLVCVRV